MIKTIQQQLNLVYIALAFLTRISVPVTVEYSQQNLNRASRYFSLIGWLIGLMCALVFGLIQFFLPLEIAVILSMLFGVLLTGCFHEDGLADTSDGFGGAWSIEDKLSIMKDSRIGTYGATAIWFSLSLKFLLLNELSQVSIILTFFAILSAHPISRSISTLVMFMLPYVSEKETAKVKPLAESHQKLDLFISLGIGTCALLAVIDSALWIIITLLTYSYMVKKFLYNQIKGFTGDTLGATQQIAELLIYTVVLAIGYTGMPT